MKHARHSLSILVLAVSAAMPLSMVTTAQAQPAATRAVSAASISSVKVQQVRALTPGNELDFTVNATPGATVTVKLAGATAVLPLSEVDRGVYEGTYTVRSRDRLTAASVVTAQAVKDGQTATLPMDRSLVVGAAPPLTPAYITGFNVAAPERVRPGDELNFSITGATGGQARVNLQGASQPIALAEVRPGVYEGSYVVRRQENLPRDSIVASAYLNKNRTEVSQRFERLAPVQAAAACTNCGRIESIDKVAVKDGSSHNVLGTVAGGVLGGVVGNQVGGGRGKDIARIAGAIGGAYAGNRIQNNMNKNEVFRVAVRMSNGTVQNFDYANDPNVSVGTRVRVEDGVLIHA